MNHFYKNRVISLFFFLSLLSACSMIPADETEHKAMLTAEQIKLEGEELEHLFETNWWVEFNDPQLNQLIELGLESNLSLEQAKHRVELASQQVALAESGDNLKMNLTASGGVVGINPTSTDAFDADYSAMGMLMPSVSYQFDFWGKNGAAIAAATDQKLSLEAQQAQAKLMIAASIAHTYFELQNSYQLEETLTLLVDNIQQQNQVLKNQVERGLASEAQSLQNLGDVDSLSAQLSAVRTQQQLAKNQLALYLAKTPEALGDLVEPNAQLVTQLNRVDTIPLNLVGRRPDIVASKWMVEANREGIEQTKASYYPDVNLNAFGVFQALANLSPERLFLGGGAIAVNLPLYDGGVRDAQYTSANIQYDEAVSNYNQTVLTAVKQSSDAIVQLKEAQQQQVLIASSSAHYYSAYQLLEKRYQRGVATFTEMNAAQMRWREQMIEKTNADNEMLQSQLQLIVALGGGYQDPNEDNSEQQTDDNSK